MYLSVKHYRSTLSWVTSFILFCLPFQTRWIQNPWAPSEFIPVTISIFVVEVLILFCFLHIFFYPERLYLLWIEIKKPFLFFVIALCVSTYLSAGSYLIWIYLFHLLCAICLFILIVIQKEYTYRFVIALSIGLIVSVGIGVGQVFTGHFPASTIFGIAERSAEKLGDSVILLNDMRILRAYGTFSHPNIFGGYLSVVILLLLQYVQKKKWIYVLIGILLIGLLLTMSKSAIIGLCLSLMIGSVVYMKLFANKIKYQFWRIISICGVFLLIASMFMIPRLSRNVLELQSMNERIEQWRTYPHLIENIFFGSGMGTYAKIWQNMYETLDWWVYQPIHNIPALLLVEIGLFGIISICYLFYIIIKRGGVLKKENLFPLMALCVLFIISLFDHYLWTLWSGLALVSVVLAFSWTRNSER